MTSHPKSREGMAKVGVQAGKVEILLQPLGPSVRNMDYRKIETTVAAVYITSSSLNWRDESNVERVEKKQKSIYQNQRIVFFTIRWWDPATFAAMHPQGKARASWPYVEDKSYLWTWLFVVPLVAYTLWQLLYFLIVNVLRRQRLLRDPEVMTSYRELSKKAQKANNVWWQLSGVLGDQNRNIMYIVLQGVFTVATMALTVPIFLSYEMHVVFQILKVSASVWNGGSFLLEVMPKQVVLKEKKKLEMKPIPVEPGLPSVDLPTNSHQNDVQKQH